MKSMPINVETKLVAHQNRANLSGSRIKTPEYLNCVSLHSRAWCTTAQERLAA